MLQIFLHLFFYLIRMLNNERDNYESNV